jgi:hypothetical protein
MELRFALAGTWKLEGILPSEFVQQAHWLVKLSLLELTETLIRLFNLGEDDKELAYIQSFQDLVLEFVQRDGHQELPEVIVRLEVIAAVAGIREEAAVGAEPGEAVEMREAEIVAQA